MRTLRLAALVAVVTATPLLAQGPPPGRRGNARELQQQVMQRFLQNLQVQAGLTEEQADGVETIVRDGFQARAQLAEEERDLWRALEAQMRPGVAADADSVTAILAGLVEVGRRRVALNEEELRVYAEILEPVQQAQVMMAWRRLQMQIERIRQGRMQPGRMPG